MASFRALRPADLEALKHGLSHTIGKPIPLTEIELSIRLAGIEQIQMERQIAENKAKGHRL